MTLHDYTTEKNYDIYDLDLFLISDIPDSFVAFSLDLKHNHEAFIYVFEKENYETIEDVKKEIGLENRIIIKKGAKTDPEMIYKIFQRKIKTEKIIDKDVDKILFHINKNYEENIEEDDDYDSTVN